MIQRHQNRQPIRLLQLEQRKSACDGSAKEQFVKNSFAHQRSSLDLATPPAASHNYHDTDSELEGIFGDCEVLDDFETSTTMSDSPNHHKDMHVWPVMIGNNVYVSKRRPKTYGGQQSKKEKTKKMDPPPLADAALAALVANRRGSIARPRPTGAGKANNTNGSSKNFFPNHPNMPIVSSSGSSNVGNGVGTSVVPSVRSPKAVPLITTPTNASTKSPNPPQNQSNLKPDNNSTPTKMSPMAISNGNSLMLPHDPNKSNSATPVGSPYGGSSLSVSPNVRSPLLPATTVMPSNVIQRRQKALFAQANANTKKDPSPNQTATQIAAAGKPSLTGLLYGAQAANLANAHASQYQFRGHNANEPRHKRGATATPQRPLTANSGLKPAGSLLT